MGRFDELVEAMANPPEEGMPDSIYDDLRLAHGDEMAIIVQERDGAQTKVQELEGTVSQLRTQLYDATMNAGSKPKEEEPETDPEDDDDDSGEGIDSLFGDK